MENLEGKVFIGIRVLLALFMLAFLISFGSNSRVADTLGPRFIFSLFAVALASWIAVNYGRGKNWARIWMLIAGYFTVVALIVDMASFGDISGRIMRSGFGDWINVAMVIDVLCMIGTVYVVVMVHKNKARFVEISAPKSQDPEAVMANLKNMLDKGLITREDFDKKKEEILKQM